MTDQAPPLRVLLVDDDPDDRFMAQDLLDAIRKNVYCIELATSFEMALAALARHDHDVVLIDYLLGAYTGVDLLNATKDDPLRPPMIIMNAQVDAEVDGLCLSAGAADYLEKTLLDRERLERSLRYAIEHHRLRRLLADREREYRNLFESSPMPIWIYDPKTLLIVAANAAAVELYGYTRAEFLSLSVTDLTAEEGTLDFFALNHGSDLDKETSIPRVWRHLRKDGSILNVEIACSDVRFSDAVRRMVLTNDISARQRAENAWRASEVTLRHVLNDLADGLVVASEDCRMLFVNQAANQIFGYSDESETSMKPPKQLPKTILQNVEMKGADGNVLSVDMRTSDTLWEGEPAHIMILQDVTSKRSNERQLILLRRAIESTNDGVLIVDSCLPDMPIIYANAAFERVTGYSAAEAIGRNARFLYQNDREQAGIADIRTAITEQRSCTVVLRNYRKDGSLFWNRLTLSPVRDDNGMLTHYVSILVDISEQKRLEDERDYLDTHDSVTGLFKYAGSEMRIDALLQDAIENGKRMVLLFIDIDRFNTINDTMGFAMGDAALRRIGDRLRDVAVFNAEVLRYAGDQFLVALGDISIDTDLLQLASSFCACIAEPMIISPVVTLYLTASVGASAYPDSGQSLLELTRQAEIATNRAKRGGRNGAFVFGNELRETLNDRMELGGSMRLSLARGEFLLHYQPVVDAQDGTITSLEALVRWNSPRFGLLPPRRFIPIAEDSGVILQLGAWVLRSACLQLRSWVDQGFTNIMMSVNVSAAQMQRSAFVDEVRQIVAETGISPDMLELELTESVLMDSAERAALHMRELKELGVRLALDDFGMGYSSLSYLQHFPLNKIKIDQTFVSNITQDGNNAALVRAIISIGHHLGLRVVAEGVETAAQYGYLRRNHCDEFQGHYFSKPIPSTEIPELLRRRFLLPAGPEGEVPQRTLLILDDEENIRRSLIRLLRRDGYYILEASSAEEAFELLPTNRVQVILSDQRMPGMSGTEFLSQVKEMYPDTVRMVLSGFTDLSSVTEAINQGAIYKFLTKPWDDEALRAQVLEAFRRQEQSIHSEK